MAPRAERPFLPPLVWLLGAISCLTDVASEAIYPLLPLFLTQVLGARVVSIGVIEGAAEATASFVKVLSGRASDRSRRRRGLVIGGYGLSSVVRPLVGLATTWGQVLTLRLADRLGKGLRSAPRDALLAAAAPPDARGRVFGFHRAMDHLGAVLGPLIAALFLWVAPGELRSLFLLTLVPGLAVIALLFAIPQSVDGPVGGDASSGTRSPGAGASGTAAVVPGPSPPPRGPIDLKVGAPTVSADRHPGAESAWSALPGSFFRLLAVLFVFTLGNSTDAFLLLQLSAIGVAPVFIPLLWASLHVVKVAASVGGGLLSDRIGRRPVITLGWLVYTLVYAGFATARSPATIVTLFLVYGLYYGLTEGVEKALVADVVPAGVRATAFGAYTRDAGCRGPRCERRVRRNLGTSGVRRGLWRRGIAGPAGGGYALVAGAPRTDGPPARLARGRCVSWRGGLHWTVHDVSGAEAGRVPARHVREEASARSRRRVRTMETKLSSSVPQPRRILVGSYASHPCDQRRRCAQPGDQGVGRCSGLPRRGDHRRPRQRLERNQSRVDAHASAPARADRRAHVVGRGHTDRLCQHRGGQGARGAARPGRVGHQHGLQPR